MTADQTFGFEHYRVRQIIHRASAKCNRASNSSNDWR